MRLLSLKYKEFRGRSFNLKFTPGINALIGMNGVGKSNTLDLIAILAGTENSTDLIRGDETIEFVSIVMVTNKNKRETLILQGGFDLEAIAAFKKKIQTPVSFVLREYLDDETYVGARRPDAAACQKDMLEWLDRFDMPLGQSFYHNPAEGASLLVSETGAQRYILSVGMRRPPAGVIMLLDSPERHLHIMSKRIVTQFYQHDRIPGNQIILATHSPEVISPLDSLSYAISKSGGLVSKQIDQIIDLAAFAA